MKKSSDHEAAEEFVHKFKELVSKHNLTAEQIFNADETGLLWRCLPNKTPSGGAEKVADRLK